jgi:hypothetical protein
MPQQQQNFHDENGNIIHSNGSATSSAKSANNNKHLSKIEMMAQSFILFLAG